MVDYSHARAEPYAASSRLFSLNHLRAHRLDLLKLLFHEPFPVLITLLLPLPPPRRPRLDVAPPRDLRRHDSPLRAHEPRALRRVPRRHRPRESSESLNDQVR